MFSVIVVIVEVVVVVFCGCLTPCDPGISGGVWFGSEGEKLGLRRLAQWKNFSGWRDGLASLPTFRHPLEAGQAAAGSARIHTLL